MALKDLARDSVTLVKADGQVVRENIKAQVSSGLIITFEKELPIQPNDHFVRVLPSGLAEDFVVIDPGFHAGLHGIPSHYQSKVRRSDTPEAPAKSIIQNITNNLNGANPRVNINSTDNSTNLALDISPMKLAGLLEEVKPYIHSLPEPQRSHIIVPVELLENEIRSGRPDQSKVHSALTSMKTIAEGAAGSLVASGIGALVGNMLAGS
ncbi:UNVERIFIED_ORG: hypothetical protein J2W66_004381 [Agrobacterium larrymoorei]|nr:hypothetical protein [Agrobacterium larrymoorei]